MEEISRGGQGVVYKAIHDKTGLIYACKKCLFKVGDEADNLVGFLREVLSLSALDLNFVPKIDSF